MRGYRLPELFVVSALIDSTGVVFAGEMQASAVKGSSSGAVTVQRNIPFVIVTRRPFAVSWRWSM